MTPQSAAASPLNTPANRCQFAFRVQGLAEGFFAVKSFTGNNHGLDQDYCFEVALQSPELIMPDRLVGQPAVLELLPSDGGAPVLIPGIICNFTWDGASLGGRDYVASLASPLYPLKLRNNQRIFLGRSIPQIIEEVLEQAELSAAVAMELQGDYPLREYTVQYAESDWDFVTRLAAACGIFFRIDADSEQSRVLFHDAIEKLPPLPGDPLLYQLQTGASRARETLFSFNAKAEVLTDGVDLRDYNYRIPESLLDASASQTVSIAGHGRAYRFGENHKDLDQAGRLAGLRQQELDWQRLVYIADTDCRTAAPGLRLSMTGHPDSRLNGDYLIIAVDHLGHQGGSFVYGEQSKGMTYRNRLTLIPFGTPYRPQLPEPHLNHGIFTARIETTGGDYGYLDDQGRYRVRPDFDAVESPQGQASHAARLMQPYSGDNFGSHTPLHAGTEVALTCVNGDLDRPVILGVLPNPQIPAPVNANNHSQNILRSFGGNELLMEDRKGQERIELFTRERKNLLNLDAKETGHKISLLTMEGEMEIYVAKTLLKESGDTHSTVVGDNHLITVENSQRLMTKNQQVELEAATDIRIKATDNIRLQAEKKDIQLRADKDMVVRAAEGMSVEVRNDNLTLLVKNGELSIDVAKELNILGQGGGTISIGQSGGKVEIDPAGNVTISSHTVNINAQSVAMGGAQNSQGGGGAGIGSGGSGDEGLAFGLLDSLPGATRKYFESEDAPDSQPAASGTGQVQTRSGTMADPIKTPAANDKTPPAVAEQALNWVDLEYLYADGTGVAGAGYTLTDSQGNTLAQGNLDPNGRAHVDLPLEISQVQVQYHDDPAEVEWIQPADPQPLQAPQGWFERMTNSLSSAWQTSKDAADWTWGMLQGDFNEEATVGQIATNAVITAIPLVDQVGDARDLGASLKQLVWEKRYTEYAVWLALFFTLIGLVPTFGSLLKGVLKLVWKGAKLDELLKVFNVFMKGNGVRWLKGLRDGKLLEYGKEAARQGHEVIDALAKNLKSIKGYIPPKLQSLHAKVNGTLATLNQVKLQLDGMFERIARELAEKLGRTLDEGVEASVGGGTRKTLKRQQGAAPPPAFRRTHVNGNDSDPYSLMPDGKPMGAKEGNMPGELYGFRELSPDYEKYVSKGYPDLSSRGDFKNFSTIEPRELPPGTKIYRIIDEGSSEMSKSKSGCYWAYEMPESKTAWRSNYAVKDSWNDNGYYVEHTVGPEGLKVWDGKTAGQLYEVHEGKKFYLEGGNTQIFVEYGKIENVQPKLTNWTDASK